MFWYIEQDTGPQFPTDITKMLKYGTNIIQAIGYFSSILIQVSICIKLYYWYLVLTNLYLTGNYIIAIAFMSKTPTSTPKLPDYVHPVIENPVSGKETDFAAILVFCLFI